VTAQGLVTALESGNASVRLYQPLFNGSIPLLVSPPAAVVLALLEASSSKLGADPNILIRIRDASSKLGEGLSALEAAPAHRVAPDGSYLLLHRPGAPRLLLRTHLMSRARVGSDAQGGAQHDAPAGGHLLGGGGGGGTANHSVPLLLPSDGTKTPIGKLKHHLPQLIARDVAADSAGASSRAGAVARRTRSACATSCARWRRALWTCAGKSRHRRRTPSTTRWARRRSGGHSNQCSGCVC
jgi:hypothetical protein